MTQYCRYCGYCFHYTGKLCVCNMKDTVLTETAIKQPNRCPKYVESPLGDVITGKKYQPREKKKDGQTSFLF